MVGLYPQPANATRDDGEWDMVRKLVHGGFVQFAEPCIIECHEGPEMCESCTSDSGGSHDVHARQGASGAFRGR